MNMWMTLLQKRLYDSTTIGLTKEVVEEGNAARSGFICTDICAGELNRKVS
jgi:hypothetical protein